MGLGLRQRSLWERDTEGESRAHRDGGGHQGGVQKSRRLPTCINFSPERSPWLRTGREGLWRAVLPILSV